MLKLILNVVNYSRITNEAAIKETLQKLRDVEKENDEILSRLAKKERECEAKSVEKVGIMNYKLLQHSIFWPILTIGL